MSSKKLATTIIICFTTTMFASDYNVDLSITKSSTKTSDTKSNTKSTILNLGKDLGNGLNGSVLLGYAKSDLNFGSTDAITITRANTIALSLSQMITNYSAIAFSTSYSDMGLKTNETISGTLESSAHDNKVYNTSVIYIHSIPITNKFFTTLITSISHKENKADEYKDHKNNNVNEEKVDSTNFSAGIKPTYNFGNGYSAYASLKYILSDKSISEGDKDYSDAGLGFKKRFSDTLTFSINGTKQYGLKDTSSNSMTVNISKKF